MNSTLKIQTPEAITLIEKIKAEIKKARGVKSQTKVAESAQTAGETLMVIFSKAIYVRDAVVAGSNRFMQQAREFPVQPIAKSIVSSLGFELRRRQFGRIWVRDRARTAAHGRLRR